MRLPPNYDTDLRLFCYTSRRNSALSITPEEPLIHLRERRQPEGVAAVLDPENTEQEAVHDEDDPSPNYDRKLLRSGICYPWYLQRQ
jgi:hypothetical protein